MSKCNPVSHGEVVSQSIIIEGPIYYLEPGSDPPTYHKLMLQPNPNGDGTYTIQDTGTTTTCTL